MAVTYDLTTDVGKVRLLIGDKDIADPVFTDEEITVFLTDGGSVPLAAATALESWASQYAANADSEKIGDYAFTQKIVDKMLALAKRFRDTEAASPYLTWAELDLIVGSDITAGED